MSEEMRRIDEHINADETDDAPPGDWETPPDGADCDGFGGIGPALPPEAEQRIAREQAPGATAVETDPETEAADDEDGEKPA